jgi:hypothetical protein
MRFYYLYLLLKLSYLYLSTAISYNFKNANCNSVSLATRSFFNSYLLLLDTQYAYVDLESLYIFYNTKKVQ